MPRGRRARRVVHAAFWVRDTHRRVAEVHAVVSRKALESGCKACAQGVPQKGVHSSPAFVLALHLRNVDRGEARKLGQNHGHSFGAGPGEKGLGEPSKFWQPFHAYRTRPHLKFEHIEILRDLS